MPNPLPVCLTVTVFAFRGNRSAAATAAFQKAWDDARAGVGPDLTPDQCLLHAGHAGVSVDAGVTIYGFNPDPIFHPMWKVLDLLQAGDALPGVVTDDTAVFKLAGLYSPPAMKFGVVLPAPDFRAFGRRLDTQRERTKYKYGFPNGDGDCNCTTWLERIGLPLLSGRMNEFTALPGFVRYPTRRFGACT